MLNQLWPKMQVFKLRSPPLSLLQMWHKLEYFANDFSRNCIQPDQNSLAIPLCRSKKTSSASNSCYVWDVGCICGLGSLFPVEEINKFIFAISPFWLEKFYASGMTCSELSLLLHIKDHVPCKFSEKILWIAKDNVAVTQKLWSVIFFSFLLSILVLKKL